MGTPILPEPEYGDDCESATPEFFAPGKTPKYINAYFDNVWYCSRFLPPLPSRPAHVGSILLKQRDEYPCEYLGSFQTDYDVVLSVSLNFDMNGIAIGPAIHNIFTAFFADQYLTYENRNTIYDCDRFRGWGGTVTLDWTSILRDLCWTYGLVPLYYPLAEYIGEAEDGHVVRFCHPPTRTNIKIKFDDNLYHICRP